MPSEQQHGPGTMNMPCQPQNGGNPNAAAGSYLRAGPPVNYAKVKRIHEDDSMLVKYYDAHGQGGAGISKMAFTSPGTSAASTAAACTARTGRTRTNFVGVMLYDRTWFDHDLYAVTLGGGFMNNPGRYWP